MSDQTRVPGSTGTGDGAQHSGADPQAPQQVRLEIDDSNVEAHYANLCLVSSTPEEVILDLALNPNPLSNQPQTRRVRISQRVIMNHYTAKRLTALLHSAVQRHEQMFGVLEMDVSKRTKPQSTAD